MKDKMVRIKIINQEKNKYLYSFNFNGYGWIEENELKSNKNSLLIQCEDNYEGTRGYTLDREYIVVLEEQPEYPY